LQNDAANARKALKEALVAKDVAESKFQDQIDAIEMVTLDKEMAEERAETLVLEVEGLKERIEELTLDLDVYREGTPALLSHHRPETEHEVASGSRPDVEITQLAKQNERLKEALIKCVP
jgi:dynactin 1